MNINNIIREEIERFLVEDVFTENMPVEAKKKKNSKKSKKKKSKEHKWKFGTDNVNYAEIGGNNFEKTAINAKKKGSKAPVGAQYKAINVLTQDGVNTTEVCRKAGFKNPNNKASVLFKVKRHRKFGNGDTAYIRVKDLERLINAARSMGIAI